jgi:hypothetical protein
MKQCSDTIPIQKSLKQGETLSPLLSNSASEFYIRKNHVKQESFKWTDRITSGSVLIMVVYCRKTYTLWRIHNIYKLIAEFSNVSSV